MPNELLPEQWRRNAAAVIVDAKGSVLIGKAAGVQGYWHFPQGGARANELIEDTLVREVQEEVGLREKDYSVMRRQDDLHYYYRAGHKKTQRWIGQKQTYFFLRTKKEHPVTKLRLCKEFVKVMWMKPENIRLNMFSPSKRKVIEQVLLSFLGLSAQDLRGEHRSETPHPFKTVPYTFMDVDKYKVKPGSKVNLDVFSTTDKSLFKGSKEEATFEFDKLRDEMANLQKVLFAQNKHKLLVIIQAMDTGGKDGCIKNVFSRIDPQGIHVASFKKPTEEELGHDFLWRVHKEVPKTGEIVIFNRSHYEDIVAVRIKNLLPKERWEKRYQHIVDFEKLLVDEGTTVIKIFLHISKAEQKIRLESRLKDPSKYWKFMQDDLDDRAKWDEFQEVYSHLIEATNTPEAPWYVIPADRKWYRNLVVAELIVNTLQKMDLQFPKVNFDPSKIVVPD